MVYDVFISYRRDGGFDAANTLNDRLTGDGYTVSFDIRTLREGDFDKALLADVEQCRDFILVVDKHCFDKTLDSNCNPEEDWVRIELAYALKLKKNIIPVLLPGAKFPEGLPDDVKDVRHKHGPTYSHEYYDYFYDKLKGMMYSVSRNMSPGLVTEKTKWKELPRLTVESDLDCKVFVNGEEFGTLHTGDFIKMLLIEGNYRLKFVSVENEEDYIMEDYPMPSQDRRYKAELLTRRQERERKEQEREREARERLERERRERETRGEFEVGGVKFKMVKVEGGRFEMGATAEQGDAACDEEKPPHWVEIDGYLIGETVVTQELWKEVTGKELEWTKKFGRGADYPAYNVSYDKIVTDFLPELKKKLKEETGILYDFRLPTEAEWEYAARGGKWKENYRYSGNNDIYEAAWYKENSNNRTHKVKDGEKKNKLNLFDMSGNVFEWCQDWIGGYVEGDQSNPTGPEKGERRVLRGGSFKIFDGRCRVSYRGGSRPSYPNPQYGFRLALSIKNLYKSPDRSKI